MSTSRSRKWTTQEYGHMLRQLRMAQGLSLARVADKFGMSARRYSDIEMGRGVPQTVYERAQEVLGLRDDDAKELQSGSRGQETREPRHTHSQIRRHRRGRGRLVVHRNRVRVGS